MLDRSLTRIAFLFYLVAVCLTSASLARNVHIEIVHTTDLRGQLLALESYGKPQGGGLLRCASAISAERENNANILLLDAGNALFGTPETDVLDQSIMVRAMNRIGYDAYVPARDDFDYGVEYLQNELKDFKATLLAANISPLGLQDPLPRLEPFEVFTRAGLRIAVVGLANPATPSRVRPDYLRGLEWQPSCEALARIMPDLKSAKADIHVLLAHQGLAKSNDPDNEIRQIAERFPVFDIIIGGNTHQTVPSLVIENALYTQSGSRGCRMGVVEIEYDTVKDQIADIKSRIIDIDESVPVEKELKEHLSDQIELAQARLNETVGVCERNFRYRPQNDDLPVASLLTHAVQEAVEAEIVLLSLQTKQSIWAREQKEKDLWRVIPYEEGIGIAMLTINEIESILQRNSEFAGNLCFLQSLGLNYEMNNGVVEKIALADGTVPHPRRKFRVAFNSFVLASAGGRFNIVRDVVRRPRSRLRMHDLSLRDAVRKYMKKHSPLKGL